MSNHTTAEDRATIVYGRAFRSNPRVMDYIALLRREAPALDKYPDVNLTAIGLQYLADERAGNGPAAMQQMVAAGLAEADVYTLCSAAILWLADPEKGRN